MLQANLLSKEILTKNEHKEGPNLKHITLIFWTTNRNINWEEDFQTCIKNTLVFNFQKNSEI